MDFLKDLSEYLKNKNELIDNISINDNSYDILLKYIDICERKITSNIMFNVVIHDDVKNKLVDLDEEEKECYYDILKKLKNGEPIDEYYSTGIYKYKQFDSLFYNWKIKHLHLQHKNFKGTYNHKKSSKILLLVENNHDIGLIDIVTHPDGNKWFRKAWLCNVDDLFPMLYTTYPNAMEIIDEIIDDDEICKISKKSIIFVKIKNKIIVSFPGVASSGNSNMAVSKADFIANQLNALTKDCEKDKVSMFRQIETAAKNANFSIRPNRRHKMKLIIENANLVIYDENYYVKQFLVKSSDWFGYDIYILTFTIIYIVVNFVCNISMYIENNF